MCHSDLLPGNELSSCKRDGLRCGQQLKKCQREEHVNLGQRGHVWRMDSFTGLYCLLVSTLGPHISVDVSELGLCEGRCQKMCRKIQGHSAPLGLSFFICKSRF